ncbi:hypothetical protein ScalyP_jg2748 [Parmales sp. scaly parma]|nr:hypothetical protein ScalyP_jg2748 [Parmales sp. scaly parma]
MLPTSNPHSTFLLLLLSTIFQTTSPALFKQTSVAYDQTGSVTVGDALEISVAFQPWSKNLTYGDMVFVQLPRFSTSSLKQGVEGGSPGENIAIDQVELAPSMYWKASWTEGTWCAGCSNPYSGSMLSLQVMRINGNLTRHDKHTVTIFKSNGIKAFCGHSLNSGLLKIGTNSSGSMEWMDIETSPLVGNGCADKSSCNLHGTCDYCYNTCTCDYGYGNPTETYEYVKIDCGDRVCPSGRAIRDIPTLRRCPHGDDPVTAANETDCYGVTAPGGKGTGLQGNGCYTECSNRGVCVWTEGVGKCKCNDGFLGQNCGTMSGYGNLLGEWVDPAWSE